MAKLEMKKPFLYKITKYMIYPICVIASIVTICLFAFVYFYMLLDSFIEDLID